MDDYKIVTGNDPEEFQREVGDLLRAGYLPAGGISTGMFSNFVQAMYKKPTKQRKPQASRNEYPDWFEDEIWQPYKTIPEAKNGNKSQTFSVCKRRIEEGAAVEDLASGLKRYAAFCHATGRWPKLPETFFGVHKHYENDWTIPKQRETLKHIHDSQLEDWARRNGAPGPAGFDSYPAYRKHLEDWYNNQ